MKAPVALAQKNAELNALGAVSVRPKASINTAATAMATAVAGQGFVALLAAEVADF
jgi:hypothetical protein